MAAVENSPAGRMTPASRPRPSPLTMPPPERPSGREPPHTPKGRTTPSMTTMLASPRGSAVAQSPRGSCRADSVASSTRAEPQQPTALIRQRAHLLPQPAGETNDATPVAEASQRMGICGLLCTSNPAHRSVSRWGGCEHCWALLCPMPGVAGYTGWVRSQDMMIDQWASAALKNKKTQVFLNSIDKERHEMQHEAQKVKCMRDRWEQQAHDLRPQMEESQRALEDKKRWLGRMGHELTHLTAECRALDQKVATVRKQTEARRAQLKGAIAEDAKYANQLEQDKVRELKRYQDRVAQLNQQIEGAAVNAEQKEEQLQAQIAEFREARDVWKKEKVLAHEEYKQEKDETEELVAKADAMRERADTARLAARAARARLEDANKQAADAQAKLPAAQAAAGAAEAAADEAERIRRAARDRRGETVIKLRDELTGALVVLSEKATIEKAEADVETRCRAAERRTELARQRCSAAEAAEAGARAAAVAAEARRDAAEERRGSAVDEALLAEEEARERAAAESAARAAQAKVPALRGDLLAAEQRRKELEERVFETQAKNDALRRQWEEADKAANRLEARLRTARGDKARLRNDVRLAEQDSAQWSTLAKQVREPATQGAAPSDAGGCPEPQAGCRRDIFAGGAAAAAAAGDAPTPAKRARKEAVSPLAQHPAASRVVAWLAATPSPGSGAASASPHQQQQEPSPSPPAEGSPSGTPGGSDEAPSGSAPSASTAAAADTVVYEQGEYLEVRRSSGSWDSCRVTSVNARTREYLITLFDDAATQKLVGFDEAARYLRSLFDLPAGGDDAEYSECGTTAPAPATTRAAAAAAHCFSPRMSAPTRAERQAQAALSSGSAEQRKRSYDLL